MFLVRSKSALLPALENYEYTTPEASSLGILEVLVVCPTTSNFSLGFVPFAIDITRLYGN